MKSLLVVLLMMVSANGEQAPTPLTQTDLEKIAALLTKQRTLIQAQSVEIVRLRRLCIPGDAAT